MDPNLKTVFSVIAGAAVAGIAVTEYVTAVHNERAKRREIEKNRQIELEAIRRASTIVQERLNDRAYLLRGLGPIMEDLSNEIRFQSIALRTQF